MAVSSVTRIDKIQPSTNVDTLRADRPRLDPDKLVTSYDSVTSTDLSGFTSNLDPDTQAQIDAYYASLSPEEQEKAKAASLQLGQAILSGQVSATSLSSLSVSSQTQYVVGSGATANTNQTNTFILSALSGMESYLKGFADDVSANTNAATDLRNSYTELADMIKNWGDDPDKTQEFTWNDVTYDDAGNRTVTPQTKTLNKADAEELLQKLDNMKANCSDMAEIKKFDLQAKYQDYSQAINTITNILKEQNDSAKAAIANLK